jgi:hypothetical protein
MKEQVLNSKEPLSTQQSKKVVFVEMFRAGPQISSTGQKLVFTEQDLDQVVGSYNPATHEAPLIIGHDQEDGTPALGWVQKIWRKGKELWGKVELTPKAEKLIRDGVFKKVSSSFYLPEAETNPTPGKLSLRHLGLVSIPAVKGLTAFSEQSEHETITITPSEGEFSISFKEHLGKNLTMARKKTKPETPASVESTTATTQVVDHGEGGMTVNINIGGGGSGASAPNVYDDSGSKISETGAPADYDMDYGMEGDMPPAADGGTDPMMPSMGDETEGEMPPAEEGEGDDLGLEGDEGGEEMEPEGDMPPAADGASGGADPGMETDDISGEMEGEDEKIAQLASEYEIEDLIKALALKTEASSMTEGGGDMSYGEMPEGLKKAIEKKKGESTEEEDEEDEKHEDMGETVKEGEKPKGDSEPSSEAVKEGTKPSGEQVYSEEEAEEEKEEDETSEHSEDYACGSKKYSEEEDEDKKKKHSADHAEEATGTLDHSESAIGVQGQNDLQARVAELEAELAQQRKAMREKEISDFCETLYEGGKLTQQIVSKTDLVRFMETLNSKNSVNFSETGKASQFDFFKTMLNGLPSMVSFEEFATPASAPPAKKQPTPSATGYVYDPSTADLHAQALEYSESKGVEYTVALKAILSDS